MRISILYLLALALIQPVCARANESQRTALFVHAFNQVVTRRDGQATDATVQTVNIAREHRDIWRDWNRTRRWPRIVDHYFNNPKWRRKTSATSVVRVSWYLAENGSLNTEVDNNGRSDSFGTTYDFADGRVAGYYKPREMGKIAHLISQLPASTKVTDYRDVLMISGRHNGRWIMRMYSRHRMPLAVRRLLWTITPSPFSKNNKHLSPLARPRSANR